MPQPRKRGSEHNGTMTSYLERISDISPEGHLSIEGGTEVLTLNSLKDVFLKEITNITV